MKKKILKKIVQLLNLFGKKKCYDLNYQTKCLHFCSPYHFFLINIPKIDKILNKNFSKIYKIYPSIQFLLKNQCRNGSFDEWYKNENSYCATAHVSFLFASNLKYFDNYLKLKILPKINKSYNYLKNRSNNDSANQDIANLSFQYFYKGNISKKLLGNIDYKLENLKGIEYGGYDLGYLTVNLNILSQLLLKKKNKLIFQIFVRQIYIARYLTLNFNYFCNYMFSRSSRVFLLSGFLYAFKCNLINKSEFERIRKFYEKNFEIFLSRKEIKYLSFFFMNDLCNQLELSTYKGFEKKNSQLRKNNKFEIEDLIFKDFKTKKIYIYLKNPNIFSIITKNCKYFFSKNLLISRKIYNANINIKKYINHEKNQIFLVNQYSKYIESNRLYYYSKIISKFNLFFNFGDIFKFFGKFFLIKFKKKIHVKEYKMIYFKNHKIIVRTRIISKLNIKFNNLKSINKVGYFSPTSFVLMNEIVYSELKNKKKLIKQKFNILEFYEYI